MENEIMLRVEGMQNRSCEQKIQNELALLPGIEVLQVSAKEGIVCITGGDLDGMQVVDAVESLGYTVLH